MIETIRKWAWLILSIAVVVFVFLFVRSIYTIGQYRADKTIAEEKIKNAETEISNANAKEKEWKDKSDLAMKNAAAEEAKRKEAEQIAEKKRLENEELKKKIATMPDDEIVSQIRTRLDVGPPDVFRNSFGVQFSLSATRSTLIKIVDSDYFTLTEKPDLLARIKSHELENAELKKALTGQGEALKECDATKVSYEKIKTENKGLLKKSENQARWLKITIPAGGIAVILVVLKILRVF